MGFFKKLFGKFKDDKDLREEVAETVDKTVDSAKAKVAETVTESDFEKTLIEKLKGYR